MFLLAGDKFMPEMNLRQPGFTVLMDHLQKAKKEYKNLTKQEIQDVIYIYIYIPKRTR